MVRRVLGIKPSPWRSAQLERELRYQSRSCPFLGLRLTLDKSPLPFPPPGKHAKDHLGSRRVRRRVGKAHKGLPRLGSGALSGILGTARPAGGISDPGPRPRPPQEQWLPGRGGARRRGCARGGVAAPSPPAAPSRAPHRAGRGLCDAAATAARTQREG